MITTLMSNLVTSPVGITTLLLRTLHAEVVCGQDRNNNAPRAHHIEDVTQLVSNLGQRVRPAVVVLEQCLYQMFHLVGGQVMRQQSLALGPAIYNLEQRRLDIIISSTRTRMVMVMMLLSAVVVVGRERDEIEAGKPMREERERKRKEMWKRA